MSGQNEENLKELFERFLDVEQAQRCVEDVQKAEQILRDYPAPEPNDMLIANIKAEIAIRLPARRAALIKQFFYKAAAVAAVIVILAVASIILFENGVREPETAIVHASIMPSAIWESDDITAADVELVTFTAEVEQIEDEVLALQLGEDGSDSYSTITELELELITIDSEFWKG